MNRTSTGELENKFIVNTRLGLRIAKQLTYPASALFAHMDIESGERKDFLTPKDYLTFVKDLRESFPVDYKSMRNKGLTEVLDAVWQPQFEGDIGRLVIAPRLRNGRYLDDKGNFHIDENKGDIVIVRNQEDLDKYFADRDDFEISFSFQKSVPTHGDAYLYEVLARLDTPPMGNAIDDDCVTETGNTSFFGHYGIREVRKIN